MARPAVFRPYCRAVLLVLPEKSRYRRSPVSETRFLIASDGLRIAYAATPPQNGQPGILFCGGFKSDMTGTKALALEAMAVARGCGFVRSEEHTSELQSLMRISYAVFCLKKK